MTIRPTVPLILLLLAGCQYDPNAPVTYYVPPPDDSPRAAIIVPSAAVSPSSVPIYSGPALQTYDPGYVRQPVKTWNDTPYAAVVAPVMRGQPAGTINPTVAPIAR